MSAKSEKTLNEVYGIPTLNDHQRVFYNDSSVNSGMLDADSVYKISSNNDCHYAVLEDGSELMDETQGHYLASGQQDFLATDAKFKTVQVQRAKTGGTLYLTKLNSRGV